MDDDEKDEVLLSGTRIVRKAKPGDPVDHTIKNVTTGEEMDEEEKAKLRALLVTKSIRLAPGVEEELKEHGISIEDVIAAMKAGASNKLA